MANKKAKKKTVKRAKQKKGYACEVCGMSVTVDEECGCADACDIVCCGTQMTPKKK